MYKMQISAQVFIYVNLKGGNQLRGRNEYITILIYNEDKKCTNKSIKRYQLRLNNDNFLKY